MKRLKLFSHLTEMLFVLIFVYLLIFPQNVSAETRSALRFGADTLVPSLFVYTVLSKIIISLPITQKMTKRIGIAPIVLLTGMLCGCPIGAKTAASLYEKRAVDKKQAEFLCSFTNNASVSFVLGFVGGELFGDISVGIRLLIYQLAASVVTAAVMKKILYGKEKMPECVFLSTDRTTLREALSDGAITMINIAASAVFFIVVSDSILQVIGFADQACAIFKSLLEFSSGCAEASRLANSALPLTAFSLGHCGAAVAMQVKSATDGKLSITPYMIGKLISCSTMTLLAIIFG